MYQCILQNVTVCVISAETLRNLLNNKVPPLTSQAEVYMHNLVKSPKGANGHLCQM